MNSVTPDLAQPLHSTSPDSFSIEDDSSYLVELLKMKTM